MGTERPNYMPKEEAFNEPEDFFSKSPTEISRRFCEPSKDIYRNVPKLQNDPLKAIESVDWLGPSLTEIDDPIEGLVVAAAKLETAQRELHLAPKQRENFEGHKQNIDGAIGFLGALVSTLKSKAIRRVASGATVVTMALSAAGCGNAIARPIDEITPNISPATEVFTPTDSLESPTISPTITVFPNETSTPVEIWGAAYPKSAENFVKKPSISGAEARKIIVEKGAGEDLKALENWYKSKGIIGSGMSNVAVPVVYQEGGNFNWNLMVKKNNGNFLKFTITSGKEADQLVRAMGMITYLGEKPSFEVSELKDPAGMENLTQQVIWDKSGWSVIGAFQGSSLIAWFNADAPGGGKWVKVEKPIPTVEPTKTPEPASEYFSYSSSIDPKRLAEVEGQYYSSSDYSINISDQLHFPLVGAYGYPVAYDLERDENGTQLFVLLATPGGLVKAEVKVFNYSFEALPQTMYEIDRIDDKEAKEISSSFDNLIKQINEGKKINNGSYILLISINTEANSKACLASYGRIENAGRLCTYDASSEPLTPQQMLNKIKSFVVPTGGKTPEEALDLGSYPALSSEGNMYVSFQL